MKLGSGWWALLLAAAIAASCAEDPATRPQNGRPVILALTAFPEDLCGSDSILVVCQATDPDNDTLGYDWFTDGRLKIRGVPEGLHFDYNTHEPFQVFYPDILHAPVDTVWVQCIARDRLGMPSKAEVIHFVICR